MIKIIMKNWLEYIRRNPHAPLPLKPPKGTLSTPLKKRKKLQNHCFQFPLGITALAREIEDNGVGGGGVNNVHYGLCVKSVHMLRFLRRCKTEKG